MTSRKSLDDKLKKIILKEHPLADSLSPEAVEKALEQLKKTIGQKKAIGGPIENPMEKKQKPLYEEELGMYGGGSVRKKVYARGGSTRPTRG